MKFLLILNGHQLMTPNNSAITLDYDHERGCHTVEALATMTLVSYLSQYPAVRFIDERPAIIEVING